MIIITVSIQFSNLWTCCSYFGCFSVLLLSEQHIKLPDKQLFCSSEVVTSGKTEGKVWILQLVGDVRNNVRVVNCHRQNLRKTQQEKELSVLCSISDYCTMKRSYQVGGRVCGRVFTCPFLFTPIMPEEASWTAVVKIVSPLIRFI